jgi:hypothetical protein
MKNDTVKRREIAWENVMSKILDILHPLIQITNTEQKPLLELLTPLLSETVRDKKANPPMEVDHPEDFNRGDSYTLNHAIKTYAQYQAKRLNGSAQKKNKDMFWPKPLEINFL